MKPKKKSTRPIQSSSPVRRVAIYTRKSTTHGLDQEFSSLDAQWESCAAYVRGQPSWELTTTRYDDGGFTGANLERPAFQRLMQDVESGKVDVVVVYKVDRLSRSLLDFASLVERFRKADVYFVSVTQPFLSADSDAMAQLLLNILMAFAQFERQLIAERIRDKITLSRRKGMWTGGNVPFGYRSEKSKLYVREDEAVAVVRIFQLFVELRSDAAVAKTLHAQGARTRSGHLWSRPSVANVLTNPIYAGYITLGEELNDGDHQPIIEREHFEQVQGIRRERAGRPLLRSRNPEYLLTGLLYCACHGKTGQPCGFAYTPASTRKGKIVYRYYRCISRDKLGVEVCPARPLAAESIERLVRERLAELARSAQGAAELGVRVPRRAAQEREELRRERAGLKDRQRELTAHLEKAKLQTDEAAGTTRQLYAGRRDRLAAERELLIQQLARVEFRLGALDDLVLDGAWLAEQLQSFDRVWDELLPQNRLRVVKALVERIDVNEPEGTVDIALLPWCAALLPSAERAAGAA